MNAPIREDLLELAAKRSVAVIASLKRRLADAEAEQAHIRRQLADRRGVAFIRREAFEREFGG
jgi:hypothetical protein